MVKPRLPELLNGPIGLWQQLDQPQMAVSISVAAGRQALKSGQIMACTRPSSHQACISLGSNLGDRARMILGAAEALRAREEVTDMRLSGLYETQPVGGPSGQGMYLNAAALLRVRCSAADLLALMLQIERQMGRERRQRWGPRTLDLDLLLFDDLILDTADLVIPHPRMHLRRFVLEPLAEVAGGMLHPLLGRTVAELLADLEE